MSVRVLKHKFLKAALMQDKQKASIYQTRTTKTNGRIILDLQEVLSNVSKLLI